MKVMLKVFGVLTLLACVPVSISVAEDGRHHEIKDSAGGVESLTPELRDLLSKEMQQIQKGMMSITPAYASGDWEKIEDIGLKIQGSYILKQSLTKDQIEELHNSLPAEFIELDKEFHYMAGMLSHVAKAGKSELVGFYFSKMGELCVSCHSKFATQKFNGLKKESDVSEGHVH